jgi:hypothetical protein
LAEKIDGEVLVRMKLCQLHSGKVRMERIGQELRVRIMVNEVWKTREII